MSKSIAQNPKDYQSQFSPASWEIAFLSLLLVAVAQRDARLEWFEAEDRRKAREIDRLRKANDRRALDAGRSDERRVA